MTENDANSNRKQDADDDDDIGVKRTSQLLLSGWTMLADHCPRSTCHYPLMENKRTGVVQCPKCQDRFAREHGEFVVVEQSSSSASTTTATSLTSPPVVRPATKSASAVMGQLLLKGWTMLQDSCPVCGTPLMRHPVKREECFCATCNATVIDQTQQHESKKSQSQQAAATPAAAPVVLAPTVAHTAATPASAASSNSTQLRDTLAIKLSILHDAIRDVDPVRDVARFNELCVSIQRCGNAMTAVAGHQ